jgi:hypothetical protein
VNLIRMTEVGGKTRRNAVSLENRHDAPFGTAARPDSVLSALSLTRPGFVYILQPLNRL